MAGIADEHPARSARLTKNPTQRNMPKNLPTRWARASALATGSQLKAYSMKLRSRSARNRGSSPTSGRTSTW